MRKFLPFLFASSLSVFTAHSQSARFAYAVTDVNKEGANWSYLRRVDLATGAFSDVILNGTDANNIAYDDATRKQLSEPLRDTRYGQLANAAFGTGVAAIALDKKNSRLYYTPMFIDQLRYIDLKTMKVYFAGSFNFEGSKTKSSDQSNIITRMAIGDDGNGYAITNDANHLLRFTTGKQISITDLGAIVDDPANKGMSIHNSCSSYGGDMIADDEGNLLLFSNRTNVFKLAVDTKVAKYLGAVTGLPATYTINGTAVDDNNQVLISSASDNSDIYTVDIKTLSALPRKTAAAWRTADLATSNLLRTRKPFPFVRPLKELESVEDGRVQLYPNPVTNNQFTIQYNLPEGKYTVQVKDVVGRQLARVKTNVVGKGQTENFQLPAITGSGVYLVKILDQQNKTVLTKKILVQQ